MKILPTMSRGEGFFIDGKLVVLPVQVFPLSDGMFIIRIGDNAMWFDEQGRFDGVESKFSTGTMTPAIAAEVATLLEKVTGNQGQPPETAYFTPGSDGYDAETAAWPSVN